MVRARAAAMPIAARVARYRPDMDGLRAVAVVSVIVYHALPSVLPGGFLGVDVSFVISGYLITQPILRDMHERSFSLAEFYRRRARRILPALLVVLAACAFLGWFALLPDELNRLGHAIGWSAPFMANVFFARQSGFGGYFDPGVELIPLMHLWSLGVEEQPLMARLREIAARSGAIVIDPREALCTGMTCPATNAHGMPVHVDSNHLTAAFARQRATFIDAILLAPAASRRAP